MEAAATTKEEKELLTEVTKKGLNGLDKVELQKYNTLKDYGGNIAGDVIEHFEKAQKIQEELDKIDTDLLNQDMDTGGRAIKEGDNTYKNISGQSRYDFEANLRMADLQQNGLRGYYFRQILEKEGNNVETAVEKLEKLETQLNAIDPSGDYTKEVKSLLSGEDTTSINQLGGEKLVKGLNEFKNVTQDMGDYKFNYSNYSKNEDLYFNHLVGIGGN